MKKISTLLFISFFTILFQASAQTLIQGKITDSSGIALEGVTITEKGTSNGTITNEEGKFTLNASNANAKLIFSYLGFEKREISLDGRTELNLSLQKDVKQMDEIVVMGYSEKKKAEIASAVSVVDEAQLKDVTANN